MSFEVQKAVAERVVGERKGAASGMLRKAILMNMAVRANDDGSGIYASKLKIAVWLETNERTVRRGVASLEEDGILIDTGPITMSNGAVLRNYSINLDALAQYPLCEDEFKEKRTVERKRKKQGADTKPAPRKADITPAPGADKVSEKADKAPAEKIPEDISSPSLRSGEESPRPQEQFELKAKQTPPPPKAKTVSPHSMPEDWEPSPSVRDYARKLGFQDWEFDAAVVECRDFWLDRPKEKRPGWDRTLQKRLRDLRDDPAQRRKLKHVIPDVKPTAAISEAERRRRLEEFETYGTWDARWGPRPQQEARAA